ncbi:hypothetical protein M422DRAFT_159465 [Sphaerobolus stellatus SS14]|nr:hypothetical protein M422DRAFT_159465 [Sphaerobolus stellatus SS14]
MLLAATLQGSREVGAVEAAASTDKHGWFVRQRAGGDPGGNGERLGSRDAVYIWQWAVIVPCILQRTGHRRGVQVPVQSHCVAGIRPACAGRYSGATINNSIYGVRAWHLLHGVRWAPSQDELAVVLTGVTRLAPASSHRQKREPWTVNMITQVCRVLDPDSHFDVAWFAALTTIFWSMARTVEFLVPGLLEFRADRHITRNRVRVETERGHSVMVFSLPWTKVSPEGERVFWGRQSGPADPYAAFKTHMLMNDPPMQAALFSWKHAGAWKVMTRSAFIKRMEIAAAEAGLPRVHGHGLRIGSVLEYLLRGCLWSSGDSFALYLHKHSVVLAPYIQSVPIAQQAGPVLPPPR